MPEQLLPLLWGAIGLGALSLIGLCVGISLLVGTAMQRRTGMPMVWISAAILVASLITLALVLTSRV